MARKLDLSSLDIEHNVYYRENPAKFLQLKELVERNIHSYFSMLKAEKLSDLAAWIDQSLPLLSDESVKYSTKAYWIFTGTTAFPKCKQCNSDMVSNVRSLTLGYYDYCSQECEHQSLRKEISESKGAVAKRQFDAHLASMDLDDQLRYLVSNFEDNYSRMIQTRPYLLQHVISKTPLLDDSYNTSTRLYWIFNHIESWEDERVRCQTCHTPFFNYDISSINAGYPRFCSQPCVMKDASVKKQIEDTCISKYGVKSPAQNYEIQKKTKATYLFGGFNFKSSWELAFFIYNRDAGNDVQYNPERVFTYADELGKPRKYFPDFSVNGKLYEIKGDQFFKKDGTMQNPYDRSLNDRFELKHQCGVANGVTFLTKCDVDVCLDYVASKYGSDYLQKFRKQSAQQSSLYFVGDMVPSTSTNNSKDKQQ